MQGDNSSTSPRPMLIKGHCEACAMYSDCPRMRGENICYNKKEILQPSLKARLRGEKKT